ncbi:origin recognition complex subunit 5 [Anthonomus grandis grandis]|uniref:origin recognition complex subunit 5 n=1 Tax=Anthonomus grandis grandis TaxID=2921223 RepID=UPI00216584BD|nr:origin recognition complex subunit 5 [Anthonomus grandis grandis]
MDDPLSTLKHSYPGRETEIEQLWQLFGTPAEPFPHSVYICGGASSGKSSIVNSLLETLKVRHATINLIECYTSKILFESILNKLMDHRIDPKSGAPYAKCDNLMEFISCLKNVEINLSNSVIVVDKAEELRGMEANLLPAFLTLPELTEIPISVIFLSEIVFEKYYYRLNVVEPIKIHFPQYTKDSLLDILARDFDHVRQLMTENFGDSLTFDREFYRKYLNVFLSVFYRACRDLRELRYMSRKNFLVYCEPIVKEELTVNDYMALWRRISPTFTASAEVLYLRLCDGNLTKKNNPAQDLELPFYGKYLLISAYLASYNSLKDDKRLFMKFHGKKRKTQQDVKKKSKVSEQLNTQMGPNAFTLDRLLAIFYSILEDKVGFNNHLLVQVSSLVELQLLTLVSDPSTLDGRKYKCNVNFETIQSISRMVGFNIRKYLSDFSHI